MLISQENNYITLLNSIGIPGVRDGIKTFLNQELFSLARLNKVQLLYAQSTATVAEDLITKHNQTIQTIVEVADILNINKINYAVFKTQHHRSLNLVSVVPNYIHSFIFKRKRRSQPAGT